MISGFLVFLVYGFWISWGFNGFWFGRYSAATILALLQEVAHLMQSEKINYDELVAKTTTGITNAREYQMLWRHLAYREPLPEKFDDGEALMVCVPPSISLLFLSLLNFCLFWYI